MVKQLRFRAALHSGYRRPRRSRPLTLESLEQRNLLTADLWHAANAFLADLAETPVTHEVYQRIARQNATDPSDTDDLLESVRSTHYGASSRSQNAQASNAVANQAPVTSLAAAAVDDVFENNDSWYQASDLGTLREPAALVDLVMADQADWFQFKLTHSTDATSQVNIQFQHAAGDLDLAVYDARGRLVGYSNGTTNSESVSLAGARPDIYYVLVYGYAGAANPNYTLNINPGQSVVDDRFEPNNSFSQAANLGTLTAAHTEQNLVMADAADWYRFTMSGPGTNSDYVGINFQHARGDLDMQVFDAYGREVGYSNGVGNSERVSLAGLDAGTYYVHVYGYLGATSPSYSLIIDPGVPIPPPPQTPPVTTTPGTATGTTPSAFQIDMNLRGLSASQQQIFRDAAARWQQVVIGDLPNAVYNGRSIDDLLIDVSAGYIDGRGGILGGATADRFRSGSMLPYHGTIQFDTADLAQMEADGSLRDVVLHEIGHVLGVGTIWQSLGLLMGAGTNDPRFLGQQATAEYDTLCSCNATSVPVANTGGSGTRDGHWREATFTNELMTGYVGPGLNLPLSRLTVASLADLGYQVNLAAADPYQLM
jgi:hypothetical protein